MYVQCITAEYIHAQCCNVESIYIHVHCTCIYIHVMYQVYSTVHTYMRDMYCMLYIGLPSQAGDREGGASSFRRSGTAAAGGGERTGQDRTAAQRE